MLYYAQQATSDDLAAAGVLDEPSDDLAAAGAPQTCNSEEKRRVIHKRPMVPVFGLRDTQLGKGQVN